MPYDPRMLQMAQMGVGMMGPEQRNAFADPRSQQPKQWWEQPLPQRKNQPADQSADPSQSDPKARKPPSLMDMMMDLGRMSRPQYDRAIQGQGGYGISPKDAAQVSPWAWLGSMGGGQPR